VRLTHLSPSVRHLLHAYGDPTPHPSLKQEPLPETLRVLDEIVTDFVIETCHSAAACATYARRQKIKVDDFRFAIRRDPAKLGRVQELLRMERELKEARRAFDQNDDRLAAGESAEGGKKGKGKRGARRGSDASEGTAVTNKKRKVDKLDYGV
jgi:transcription initiation factor TFIID subunit 13